MNDSTHVLERREELVKERDRFPFDFATASAFCIFDKLSVTADDHKATTAGSYGDMLKEIESLDAIAPRMSDILDGQIQYWLRDLRRSPKNIHLLCNIGNAFLDKGDLEEAVKYFREVLRIDQSFSLARAGLAKAYVMQDRLEDALSICREDNKKRPHDKGILMNLSHIYMRQGNLQQAGDCLDRLLSFDDKDFIAHHNRGVVHLLQKRLDRAVSEFRKSTSLNPRFGVAYNALGVTYALQGSYARAIKYLRAAMAADGAYGSATKNLATAYQEKGDFAASASLIDSYLRQYPRDAEAHRIAARSQFELGNYNDSLLHLAYLKANAETLSLDRDQLAATLNNMGVVYGRIGQTSRAEGMYRLAMDTWDKPNPLTFFNLAALYLRLQNYSRAKGIIDTCVAKYPEDAPALALLASYHYERGEYDQAKQVLLGMIESNPKNVDAYLFLALVYCEGLEEYGKAIEILREAPEMDVNGSGYGILNNLAYAYLMNGQVSEAKNTLGRIKWDKASFFAYATKGLLRIREGKLEEGRRLYDYASNLAPTPEWKALTKRKKMIETSRFLIQEGKVGGAERQLRGALSTKAKSKMYLKQARTLLDQISPRSEDSDQ